MRAAIAWIFILMAVIVPPATSQILPPPEIGVLGFYGYNMHDLESVRFPPTDVCCREYQDGTGDGFAAGFLYRSYVASDWSMSARLMYTGLSAYTEYEQTRQSVIIETGPEQLTFRHSLRTTITTLGIEPMMEYHGLPFVTLLAGFGVSFPVVKEYIEEESILSPTDVLYMNGTRSKVNSEGMIPEMPGAFFSAIVGIGSRIAVTRNIALMPELSYFHTFNNVTKDSDWKPHALRAGLAIQTTF